MSSAWHGRPADLHENVPLPMRDSQMLSYEYDPMFNRMHYVRRDHPSYCVGCKTKFHNAAGLFHCAQCTRKLCPECAGKFKWFLCIFCESDQRVYCSITCLELANSAYFYCRLCSRAGCSVCVLPGPGKVYDEYQPMPHLRHPAMHIDQCMACVIETKSLANSNKPASQEEEDPSQIAEPPAPITNDELRETVKSKKRK